MTKKEKEALRAFYILAGYEQCVSNECNHIRRGYRSKDGRVYWAPGIYCQCCVGTMTDDAYDCYGREVNV